MSFRFSTSRVALGAVWGEECRSMSDSCSQSGAALVDRFGRRHTELRLSVTDRCNVRCSYCVPATGFALRPAEELLSFEELVRVVRIMVALGVRKVRLTGGEPLVRRDLPTLVAMLARLPGIDELAMTTNGILLDRYARALKAAGLGRLNISLDTLNCQRFHELTRRNALPAVLRGIAAARAAGFTRIKLNALAIRGLTEVEIVPLVRFARQHGLLLRFIEFMPLPCQGEWTPQRVLPAAEIKQVLEREFGPLEPAEQDGGDSGPARRYRFVEGGDEVGIVEAVSRPFCHQCNRLRLTADGQLRNCLFDTQGHDLRRLLRSGAADPELAALICAAVSAKKPVRGGEDGSFAAPGRAMHQIGG